MTRDWIHGVKTFEWTAAIIMLLIGVQLWFFPEGLAQGRFHPLLAVASANSVMLCCVFIAALRLLSLWTKDRIVIRRFHSCAFGRAACASLAGLFWMQMGLALFLNSLGTQTTPSIGIPVYSGLAGGEFFITIRAAYDVYRS